MIRKTLAWCVHGYTALGLVAAAGIAVAIFDGKPEAFRFAFVLMLVATIVDATDGTLARAAKVKEVLPQFDGRRLDDLIDFQTFTSLPLLLIWRADLLQGESPAWLLAPLIASAYGFCQTTAKTDDGYFLGFPSYWNIVAFYLYVLQPLEAWFTIGLLLFFAFMTFVPARAPLPDASRPTQSLDELARRRLGRGLDLDSLAHADRTARRRERRCADARAGSHFAGVPGVLSRGFVVDQHSHFRARATPGCPAPDLGPPRPLDNGRLHSSVAEARWAVSRDYLRETAQRASTTLGC